MITYETTSQDGITYIHQIKPHMAEDYWYYRVVESGFEWVKAPKWEVMAEWKLVLKTHLLASKEI